MTPEEALKHIATLIKGIDQHTKEAHIRLVIKELQGLVRNAANDDRKGSLGGH